MRTRAVAAGEEKRRKVGNGELRLPSSTLVQRTPEEVTRISSASSSSLTCDHVSVSCCSCNGSTEKLQLTDLEASVGIGTLARYNSRASKPRRELMAGSGVLNQITAKPSKVMKMPSAAELEAFFASAEKDLHKRFKDKYNYDIVNDSPLEGRFDWVQLNP